MFFLNIKLHSEVVSHQRISGGRVLAFRTVLLALAVALPTAVHAQAVNVQDAQHISAAASANTRANAGKLFADAFKRLQANEFQAAIDTYAKGLALDPANASARYFYGLALDGQGNRAAARAQYELILLLAPTSEVGNIARGILLEYDEKVSDTIEGCW